MNWGWKVALLYIIFVAGILTLVFKARATRVDLVASDYYKQEIAFGSRMEAIKNYQSLSTTVKVVQSEGAISVSFPNECLYKMENGLITLYCPSDASKDVKMDVNMNEQGMQLIDSKDMKGGLYIIKISWTMNASEYYMEQIIDL